MLALYKEQSTLLSLQRQQRKLSSFISKGGLVSAAPCSLLKPDQLSTTPAEKGLKTVSFSNIQGNVKFLGRIWWTIQWATAMWMKSANKKTKEKIPKIKVKVFITWQWKECPMLHRNTFITEEKKKSNHFQGLISSELETKILKITPSELVSQPPSASFLSHSHYNKHFVFSTSSNRSRSRL